MRIECHPALVEEAVFLKSRENRALEREFHRALDPLYARPPGRDRDEAFAEANSGLFVRWGLGGTIECLLSECPRIAASAALCAVGPAEPASARAELFVRRVKGAPRPEDRTVSMQLPPGGLLDPRPHWFALRRDLARISDMLDPAFGFAPAEFEGPVSRRNLRRDRLNVAWEIRIVAGLLETGKAKPEDLQALRAPLARVLPPGASGAGIEEVFDAIRRGRLADWTALKGWAEDPARLPEGGFSGRDGGWAGANCPICGFPTCDWFDFTGEAGRAAGVLLGEGRSGWSPEAGACRQCVELLEARAREAQRREPRLAGVH